MPAGWQTTASRPPPLRFRRVYMSRATRCLLSSTVTLSSPTVTLNARVNGALTLREVVASNVTPSTPTVTPSEAEGSGVRGEGLVAWQTSNPSLRSESHTFTLYSRASCPYISRVNLYGPAGVLGEFAAVGLRNQLGDPAHYFVGR